MTVSVFLLGHPRLELEGRPGEGPRGKKAWALLAYILLNKRPQSRTHLAEVLFPDADDPLGALRWNLAELRRSMQAPDLLRGTEIVLGPSDTATVDTTVLTSGNWSDAINLPGLTCDLLEGMVFAAEPAFETWLMFERSKLRSTTIGVLTEASASYLARRQPKLALEFASRLVTMDPYDEVGQELLIRCYARSGDKEGGRGGSSTVRPSVRPRSRDRAGCRRQERR